ncbi:MAG: hypothetical protein A3E81_07420 [Gammaproteobacteria bacterium RIFCSPHIGHO2_12_FULL_36_30]|nr:MAG: hypothetical protein A3E81_07420 [Gammaproteobacteria bacterium RIFCSPHIGHO2_12_FULL_36_30]
MNSELFEWDEAKDSANQSKHGVSFFDAQQAFFDPDRIISVDEKHSGDEQRLYCVGVVDDKVITVRFTYRGHIIRIIGAGHWRSGRKIYAKKKKNIL